MLIESEFGESVRVVRCQRLLIFVHVVRLDGGLNDAPGICPPLVCDGRTNISLLTIAIFFDFCVITCRAVLDVKVV